MSKFTCQALKSVASATVGVGALTSSGNGRGYLTGLIIGPDAATLGTSNRRFELQRSTTAPTGTSPFMQALDIGDNTISLSMFSNLSANGTLASGQIMLTIGLSEQASFRWVAAPGEAIIVPSTNNAGVHLTTPQAGNGQSVATQWYFET